MLNSSTLEVAAGGVGWNHCARDCLNDDGVFLGSPSKVGLSLSEYVIMLVGMEFPDEKEWCAIAEFLGRTFR